MDTLIRHIDRVTFQLSNRCPRASEHPQCPASVMAQDPPMNMPSGLVYEVLDVLCPLRFAPGFTGAIAFHAFSEPLADPHLFEYLSRTGWLAGPVMIYTSGWNLDANMLRDLEGAGVTNLNVTAYTPSEYRRLSNVLAGAKLTVRLKTVEWTEVIDQYSREPIAHETRCYAPLTDLCITAGGTIGLCCRDWKHEHDLVDLAKVPFAAAMRDESHTLRTLYCELARGDRRRALCQRCDHARWWNEWGGPAPTEAELNG